MIEQACSQWEHQLEALLFGELRDKERGLVEAHLSACAGCRAAHDDARIALDALGSLEAPPLPYADTPKVMRWLDLQKSRSSRGYLATAAVLLVGIFVGRLLPHNDARPAETTMASVDGEALASLERAELLADVGVRYVSGLRDVLGELAAISVEEVSEEDAALTRERARTLIRDGALLTRSLDTSRDDDLLRAIRRAEPFLEELAAFEASTNATSIRLLQASLRQSKLPRAVAGLALEDDIERALASSGSLASELDSGMHRERISE